MPFISVSAPSIVSGMSGESEKTLRETFEEAKVRMFFFALWITKTHDFVVVAAGALSLIH